MLDVVICDNNPGPHYLTTNCTTASHVTASNIDTSKFDTSHTTASNATFYRLDYNVAFAIATCTQLTIGCRGKPSVQCWQCVLVMCMETARV